jgi:hypothetical protein
MDRVKTGRMRRTEAIVAVLVAVSGICLAGLVWLGLDGLSQTETTFRILVTGTIEDSKTGDALEGVWVVPMRSMSDASLESATIRKTVLQRSYATGHRPIGGARTGSDGSFSFVFRVSYVQSIGDPDPPPFHDLKGLLIESDDKRISATVTTTSGAWIKVPPGKNVHAVLEMRTVRVSSR